MNYNYLLLIFPLYFIIKTFLYWLNLFLLFRGIRKNTKFNKFQIEKFFKKYNKQKIKANHFILRSESEYLDSLYLESNNPKYITIYFHGNRGNIYDCLYKNDIKNILSYSNLFLFDYRGYGNSTGYSNKNSIVIDSNMAYYFVMNILNYNPNKILFYGNSLGGFISSNLIEYLNCHNLPLPKGLIIQSPFYSIHEISKKLYPILHYFIQYNPDNSKLLKKIRNLLPIILLHSSNDEYIEIYHSEKLYEENKDYIQFFKINGIHDMIFYEENINKEIKKLFD